MMRFRMDDEKYSGPVRFAEKTSQNIVSADLLWEKNTVSAKKQAKKYGL